MKEETKILSAGAKFHSDELHDEIKNCLRIKRSYRAFLVPADIFLLTISFTALLYTKYSEPLDYAESYLNGFLLLILVWTVISFLNGKMHPEEIINFPSLLTRTVKSNLMIVSLIALIMYLFRDNDYSRTVVFGTIILATILELITGMIYISVKRVISKDYEKFIRYYRNSKPSENELVEMINANGHQMVPRIQKCRHILSAIENEIGINMSKEVIKMAGKKLTENSRVLSTTTIFNISGLPGNKYDYIINLRKINDIKNLDNFLYEVNKKLELNGAFLCCVETKDQRKTRLLKKYPPVIYYLLYIMDIPVKRFLTGSQYTYPLFNLLIREQNAIISSAEALGRLVKAGFRISQEAIICDNLYIEASKYREPESVESKNYGLLINLPRVGKGGKIINVYKLRTMHPYSEYIQDYIYRYHDLRNGGKFRHDFRVTRMGEFCRKVWIDELPMLINLLKGEMKLVGVRPLSKQYFELYDKNVRDRRIKYKPGLIPPFYADLPENLEAIQHSELRYLDSYDKCPLLTDCRYLGKSMYNILFRRARSN
jgi:lipopolysaccharide/colanic/teichoic acid biosynthesis glycosyltransferase